MSVLAGKTIVLGVSGGIAAYKAAEIVRLLVTAGANVRVMMTRNATEFITPLTLQTLSQNPVATDTFSLTQESQIGHIRLADSADAIVIAPATADVIAKAAVGIADDIVTTVLLATRAKIAFAPAMNVHMYEHPTVAENLAKLSERGAVIIDPAEGALACGYEGKGRLPEPAIVVAEVERMLSVQDLADEKILVTAGPTQEAIDPVRFVSNRSSGKMGFAIARAARRRGAEVKIVAGPSSLATPYGIERIESISAQELLNATAQNFPWCTTLVMAAAIADFRPSNPADRKIKKDARGIQIAMEPIADAMPQLAAKKGSRLLIGFAAETNDLDANARDKLRRKRLDLIVANDVTQEGAGFGVDTNIVTLIGADGRAESHPQLSKDAVADLILDRIAALRAAKSKPARLRAVR
ncbi:MAG: bifunctional phosphopantothenoylcysteine decarboxylase/phosphopantothenate--cysteine ligase CoaBC [Candidatus Binatus sp.]|uniref:bifunctional phosphopantothenoylcysteine decarboxylase/phosphopantothenate--cysteine ligase CoaBC n=1 Tax=Candidatus Binatus sp. TaxID=2811406 RepID=UPI002718B4E7|nr:bifunctional phosphopantothenoylcysteine decarboxylase/phosphopantothenate--cysteine ligase CoaBC [Candidatus Binatus sp.]MDO8432927.1 bifunctional phosphopantothenoylcysteine decarboxylase/phosphopantothenate--cysteine ligase CoaBC [Candidatus Binatus sp.]